MASPSTLEKPIQLPRRARNRGVALSVKEMRKIAQGLQTTNKRSSHRREIVRSLQDTAGDVGSTAEPVPKHPKGKDNVKLPEKYEMLGGFFDCLESSIGLLWLKGSMSSFTNICSKIDSLTDWRFSYSHLAQLKYILPETITIKKILVHDERTLCMKPDLQVGLQLDAFEHGGDCKSGSGYVILRKALCAQLLDFFKTQPKVMTLKRYSAQLSLITWMSFVCGVQSAVFTTIIVHKGLFGYRYWWVRVRNGCIKCIGCDIKCFGYNINPMHIMYPLPNITHQCGYPNEPPMRGPLDSTLSYGVLSTVNARPKLTVALFLEIFVFSLLGSSLTLNAYFSSLKYTSPTFVPSIVNAIASLTFIIAVVIRLELVHIRSARGVAKIIGTLISLAGATVMTLYEGPGIKNVHTAIIHIEGSITIHQDWAKLKGSILAVGSCITCSLYYIMQDTS